MLLICPVRPGDVNEELRYALRSWETNLIQPGGLTLLTVGYRPTWLSPDHHIEGNRHASMPLAVFDNILLASKWAQGNSTQVLYMNDDFFCMDPVGEVLPVKRHISLARQTETFPGPIGLWWPKSLRLTLAWLKDLGYEDPDSYEVHRPLIADPGAMAEALDRWLLDAANYQTDTVPQWRTAYGVLNKVEAYPVHDAKLSPRSTGYGTPWVSTDDLSWRRHGNPVKKRFRTPSRWEQV